MIRVVASLTKPAVWKPDLYKGRETLKAQRSRTLHSAFVLGMLMILFSGFLFSYTARQNPVLRNHFVRQHIRMMSYTDVYGNVRYRGNVRLLEREVDRLIENFMARLTHQLDTLKIHFNTVAHSRAETLSKASNDESRREAQRRWKDSLKTMADKAEDLRKTLSNVLRGLDDKSDFKPETDANSTNPGFQKEILFIQEQIVKAEQRIRDYFFVPTHTVNLQDLQGENVMIYLYRVERMSKALSARIG